MKKIHKNKVIVTITVALSTGAGVRGETFDIPVEEEPGRLSLVTRRKTNEDNPEDEEGPPGFPDGLTDKTERREAMKSFIHAFALFLIDSAKAPSVFSYPTARDYILSCSSGEAHYAHCRQIRDIIDTYGWSPRTLLTICKGGGRSRPKHDYDRAAKIARKKEIIKKELEGAFVDDPDTLT